MQERERGLEEGVCTEGDVEESMIYSCIADASACAFLAFFDAADRCGSFGVAARVLDGCDPGVDAAVAVSLLLLSAPALFFLFPFLLVSDALLAGGEALMEVDGLAWLFDIVTLLDVIAAAFIGLPRLLRLETGTCAE